MYFGQHIPSRANQCLVVNVQDRAVRLKVDSAEGKPIEHLWSLIAGVNFPCLRVSFAGLENLWAQTKVHIKTGFPPAFSLLKRTQEAVSVNPDRGWKFLSI